MTERDNARAVVFQWRLNRFVSYISKIQGDQSNFQNFPYHALVKNDQKTRSVCSLIKCRENARKRTPPPQKNKMAADISVVKRGFSFYLWIRWDFFIVFFSVSFEHPSFKSGEPSKQLSTSRSGREQKIGSEKVCPFNHGTALENDKHFCSGSATSFPPPGRLYPPGLPAARPPPHFQTPFSFINSFHFQIWNQWATPLEYSVPCSCKTFSKRKRINGEKSRFVWSLSGSEMRHGGAASFSSRLQTPFSFNNSFHFLISSAGM